MQLHEFLALTHNKNELINFLIENNVIKVEIICPKYGHVLQLKKRDLLFRCQKVVACFLQELVVPIPLRGAD